MFRQLSKAVSPHLKRLPFRSMSSTLYPHVNNFRTHSPEDGFIVKTIYEPITLSNQTVDQYVWKDINKWQNMVAIVSY